MAIRVIENKPQVERGMLAPLKNPNEPMVIQPDQLWSQLTSHQQHQVVRSLVQVGRQVLQQVTTQEADDEHD
jgi:hypothetical protein